MDGSQNIYIKMLGGFDVFCCGKRVPRFSGQGKMQKLMQYLILKEGSAVSHEELARAIWPESKAPSSALRTMLHRYRKAAEDFSEELRDAVTSHRGAYAWQIRCRADIYEFKNYVEEAEASGMKRRAECCRKAMEIYGGSLLPCVSADWAEKRRYEFQEMYIRAVLMLSGIYRAGGEYENSKRLCIDASAKLGGDGRLDAEIALADSSVNGAGGARLRELYMRKISAENELNRLAGVETGAGICDYNTFERVIYLLRSQGVSGVYIMLVYALSDSPEYSAHLAKATIEALNGSAGMVSVKDGSSIVLAARGDEKSARQTAEKINTVLKESCGDISADYSFRIM